MSQEIEIEFKNLLTENEYNKILNHFPFPEDAFFQTNHYFETTDFQLKENGSALRIRHKKNKDVLTLKEPNIKGLLETHDIISQEIKSSWLNNNPIAQPNTTKQLKKMSIPIETLHYCGKLITARREIPYMDCLLVLDYSTYNQVDDYEFELEAPTRELGLKIFHKILFDLNIKIKDTPNKVARYFSSTQNNL